jgi:mannosyltransferase OCH1-like enzyme
VIPQIIHQVWVGKKPIPTRYTFWADRLWDMNPNWERKVWTDFAIRKFLCDPKPLWDKFWSPASVSNMVRLLAVQKYGGIYLDMDMEPLQPLNSVRQLFGHAFAADQGDGRLCNAAFGAPPDHPWVNWQIKHGAGDCDPHDAAWGVYTMTKAPRDMVHIVRTDAFYPYHYDAPPEKRFPREDTICEHKWDGSWAK